MIKSITVEEQVVDLKEPFSADVKSKMESYYKIRTGQKPLRESVVKNLVEYNKKNKKKNNFQFYYSF